MSVDIVERLNRHRCVTGIRTVIDDAADEIQRLRNALQAIADNKNDEPYAADFARDELARNADEFRETLTELQQRMETLTAERDEARKIVCELNQLIHIGISSHASSSTRIREWDCFKEEE
jgi:methyl-accepting chemotaxis protein